MVDDKGSGGLEGVVAATVLPFHPDGTVDLESYQRFVDLLVADGVGGLAVDADSGEGMSLWPEERRAVLRAAVEAAGGRVPVVAGVFASFTDQACRVAEECAEDGAQYLLPFPNVHLRGQPLDPQIPLGYLDAVHRASGLPLVAFQLQDALGGVEYAPETLAAIVQLPYVTAIKESTFDAMKFRQTLALVRRAAPDVHVLSGNDNFIYESFLLGCDGALVGAGSVATELQVRMFRAIGDRRFDEAAELGTRLESLMAVLFAAPIRDYRARVKEALAMLGRLPGGDVRLPLLPIADEERQAIKKGLQQAGLL